MFGDFPWWDLSSLLDLIVALFSGLFLTGPVD